MTAVLMPHLDPLKDAAGNGPPADRTAEAHISNRPRSRSRHPLRVGELTHAVKRVGSPGTGYSKTTVAVISVLRRIGGFGATSVSGRGCTHSVSYTEM